MAAGGDPVGGAGGVRAEHMSFSGIKSPYKGDTESPYQDAYNHALGVADFYLSREPEALRALQALYEEISNLDVSEGRIQREQGIKIIEEELIDFEKKIDKHIAMRHTITQISGIIGRVIEFMKTFPHANCTHTRLSFFKGMPEYLVAASKTAVTAEAHLSHLKKAFDERAETKEEGSLRKLLLDTTDALLLKRNSLPGRSPGFLGDVVDGVVGFARWGFGAQNEIYSRLHGKYIASRSHTPFGEERKKEGKIFKPAAGSPAKELIRQSFEEPVDFPTLWTTSPVEENTFGTKIAGVREKYTASQESIRTLFGHLAALQGVINHRLAIVGSLGVDGIDEKADSETIKELEKGLSKIDHPTKEKYQLFKALGSLKEEVQAIIKEHTAAEELTPELIQSIHLIDKRAGAKVQEMNEACEQLIEKFKETSRGGQLKIADIEKLLKYQYQSAQSTLLNVRDELTSMKALLNTSESPSARHTPASVRKEEGASGSGEEK